jgi:hypothetical protein
MFLSFGEYQKVVFIYMDNQDFLDKMMYRYLSKNVQTSPKLMKFQEGTKPDQIWFKPDPKSPPYIIFTQKGLTPIVDTDFWDRLISFFDTFFGKTNKDLILKSLTKYVKENGENYTAEEFETIFGPYVKGFVSTTKLKEWWNDDLFNIVN